MAEGDSKLTGLELEGPGPNTAQLPDPRHVPSPQWTEYPHLQAKKVELNDFQQLKVFDVLDSKLSHYETKQANEADPTYSFLWISTFYSHV